MALVSVLIEAGGLLLVWSATVQWVAVSGAALTGLGFALVYPGLGVEAVQRTPAANRGLAMGAYTAFLDIALGFGSPALGLIADWRGVASAFLAGSLVVLAATAIAAWLLYARITATRDESI